MLHCWWRTSSNDTAAFCVNCAVNKTFLSYLLTYYCWVVRHLFHGSSLMTVSQMILVSHQYNVDVASAARTVRLIGPDIKWALKLVGHNQQLCSGRCITRSPCLSSSCREARIPSGQLSEFIRVTHVTSLSRESRGRRPWNEDAEDKFRCFKPSRMVWENRDKSAKTRLRRSNHRWTGILARHDFKTDFGTSRRLITKRNGEVTRNSPDIVVIILFASKSITECTRLTQTYSWQDIPGS